MEVGTDVAEKFPTEKNFCSWLGLAPKREISGGKVLKNKSLKAKNLAGQAFRMTTQSVKKSETVFGVMYKRFRARQGHSQATVSTVHAIARVVYRMLKHKVEYEAISEITIPLDVPDVRVLQTSLNACEEIIIAVENTKAGTPCRKCGKWITKLHGRDEWVLIRHFPAFGRPTYLRYQPNRNQSQDCEGHPPTTQRLESQDANSPHGFSYDNHILL